MFGRIAARYDLMNAVMTGGLDRRWRRAAVSAAAPPPDGLALDVGTGTAQLALTLARAMPAGTVYGLDRALPMLRAGRARLSRQAAGARVCLLQGDALRLPFATGTFDCLTSAFTVRNLPDLAAAFREQARVVKPGGRVVCLELTWPGSTAMRAIFPVYFGMLVPVLGGLLAGDAAAYSYLPASVRAFPPPEQVAALMEQAGLADVCWRRLGLGTVSLHAARVTDRG